MYAYFLKSLAAQARKSLSLYLLTLFGVALGVASVLAIQIINTNAITAFQGGIRAVTGESDLVIESSTSTLSEKVLADVLGTEGVRAAWPVHFTRVAMEKGGTLELLGIDLSRPDWIFGEDSELSLQEILTTPGWVAVDDRFAQRNNLSVGDTLLCSHGAQFLELYVAAVSDFNRIGPQAGSRMVITDLAQAQDLLGDRGQLSRIEVQADPEIDIAVLQQNLKGRLASSLRIMTPRQRQEGVSNLLGAFRLNLTALSLISLFVGLFLIYTSTQASLIRRRTEFGLLRSIGATRLQILALILGEALIIGVAGVALGIPIGYWIAEMNLETVNSTLTNIYLLRELEALQVSTWLLWGAASIGVGSALLGCLLPAVDMSRRSPRQLLSTFTLREGISRSAQPLFLAGLAVITLALIICYSAGLAWKPGGFILGVALLTGLPMTAPWTVLKICGAFQIRNFSFSYSLKSLADRIQSTSFAVASLGTAVTMLIGITLMVGSFRETVRVWIDTTLVADLYVTSRSWRGAGSTASLDPETVRLIASTPGVEAADRIRTITLADDSGRILVSGVETNSIQSRSRYPLLEGDPTEAFLSLQKGEGVLISEPLSRRKGYSLGDRISLPGRPSEKLTILGVIYDYTSEWGLVVMSLQQMDRLFGESDPSNLALYLLNPEDLDSVLQQLHEKTQTRPLSFITSGELRQNVLSIFDQTFAIVRLLQIVSLLIASTGITLTLIILARERASELALYRALGAERSQIFRVFVGKGVAVAILSMVLGCFGGLGLAAILIFVINRAYFGWTIQVHFNWGALLLETLLILSTAVLASLYPAFRASQTSAVELSRDAL